MNLIFFFYRYYITHVPLSLIHRRRKKKPSLSLPCILTGFAGQVAPSDFEVQKHNQNPPLDFIFPFFVGFNLLEFFCMGIFCLDFAIVGEEMETQYHCQTRFVEQGKRGFPIVVRCFRCQELDIHHRVCH